MLDNKTKIEYLNIDKLIPYARNTRTHNKEQVLKIASSIKEFGFTNPVLIDKDNGIIAGHGRVLAAEKLNIKELPCIRLGYLTEAQKKAYIIADNRLALDAGWDDELLKVELQELKELDFDIELTGFTDKEFNEIFKEVIEEDKFDADKALDEIVEPITKRGDIWQLGKHRLMCGDSTSEADIKALMNGSKADMVFTDPPYGVSASGARSEVAEAKGIRKIKNDELRGDTLTQFLSDFIRVLSVKEGASVYICYPWKTQYEFTKAIIDNGYDIKNCIIWDKKVFGLNGGKGYRPQYEMMYFCCKGEYQWQGDKSQSNIWQISREIKREEQGNHPTPKPIELIVKAINNSSKQEDIIADVFGGSGSTLIAAEQTNRICYMMELDEKYCDVIIKRYEEYTNKKAILL